MAEYKASGNLHVVAVARASDKLIIASYAHSRRTELKAVKDVLGDKQLSLTKGYYNHFQSDQLGWHLVADGNDRIFVVVTEMIFPDRVANACLDELQTQFKLAVNDKIPSPKEGCFSAAAKSTFKRLAEKYDDLRKVDKLVSLQAKVNDTAYVMQMNIQETLDREGHLTNLEDKTSMLTYEANKFKKVAKQTSSMMWWRRYKHGCIYATIVLCILAVTVPPVVLWAKRKYDHMKAPDIQASSFTPEGYQNITVSSFGSMPKMPKVPDIHAPKVPSTRDPNNWDGDR